MDSEMQEKCGVFGVFNYPKAAEYGLHTLLQRGQESVRIVASEGNHYGGNGISYPSIITGHP